MITGFPIEVETLVASTVELLKQKGAAREIGIIVASTASGEQESYDNWDGGQCGWRLSLALDLRVYAGLPAEERTSAEEQIAETARSFFVALPGNDFLELVRIVPAAVKNEAWRQQAQEWLSGAGINNQGRVRSDNIASREHQGLLFRSQPEIELFKALSALGVTFAPLPVFVRGGATYNRLEPDFVIIKDGVLMVVEVDGDTYHHETPLQAQARLQPLDDEGAKIVRVPADECGTPERARQCAARLLQLLKKRVAQRG